MSLIIATGAVIYETVTEAENSPLPANTQAPIINEIEDDASPTDIIQVVFSNVLPDWAEQSIQNLSQQNILQENGGGIFQGTAKITKGEFVSLIYKMLLQIERIEEPQNCREYYADVPPEHAAYAATCIFWQKGWSLPTYRFHVDTPVTRGETAEFLYQILGFPLMAHWGINPGVIANENELFSDVSLYHDVFYESAVLRRANIMTGYEDGRFRPESDLNRAEAAVILHRTLQKIQELGLKLY